MNGVAVDLVEPACVRLVRNVVVRRALWMRSEWAGRVVSEAMHQVIEDFGEDPAAVRRREAQFHATNPAALACGEAIAAAAAELRSDTAWRKLCHGLSEPEEQLLALGLAAEADPHLRRLYGYVLDEPAACLATPWLAELLFAWPAGTIVGAGSRLVRSRLAAPVEPGDGSKTAPWAADPSLLSYLQGELTLPAEIAGAVKLTGGAGAEWTPLFPAAVDAALDFLQAVKRQPAAAFEIEIAGAAGTGRRTLASQIAARIGRQTIAIDVAALRLEPEEDAVTAVAKAARTAYLSGTVPVWIGAEKLPRAAWDAMLPGAVTGNGLRMLVTERALDPPRPGVVRKTIATYTLPYPSRIDLWARLTASEPPAPVREWALSAADLVAAAQVAPRGAEAVAELCRHRLGHDDDELVSPVACPYTWDDLVVQSQVEQHLREFESQVHLRDAVYDDWGFGRQRPLGKGISALFCGPSGVGKTMAAQVIARSLGLQLLRLDFASVINKYVGETEKRLRQAFQRCQRANVMLFIDECDALFAHRVQTRDAQDRFANIEVDYLLQCMEAFDGVAVLATNRKSEIDPAFLRRVRFMVDFMPPTPPERLRLWTLALPAASPSGEPLLAGIDFPSLAQRLNLTGAQIKNVAIGAAFLARAEPSRIAMKHVIAAARREVAKHGTVVRPGDWEGL